MSKKRPDLPRVLELQHLLLSLSHVNRVPERKTHDHKTYVQENDTEHSYNLAMTAWFLAEYFPELDKDLVIRLALAHDLVEVYAGDTYIYGDPDHIATKQQRETAALKQLETKWPDFPAMTRHMHIYNERKLPEAKFVYALDKIMPIMLIYINESSGWKEQDVTVAQLHEVKRDKVALSPEIAPYYEKLHKLLLDSPHLIRAK